MPNFEAGCYFLTTLAPIRSGSVEDVNGAQISYQQRLRATLATLPTAQQTPATERIGLQSPFATSLRTHLCRFVVIDDAVYNGRDPENPIRGRLDGDNPLAPDAPDRLNCAYLCFAAEIDAVTEDGAPLPASLSMAEQDAIRDAYARHLWGVMEADLRAIYQNCLDFDGVTDADGFADYLKRCQVETTMPFHDYWATAPKVASMAVAPLAAVAGIPLIALAMALIGWLFGTETTPLVSIFGDWPPGEVFPWALLASVAGVYGAYRYIMARGANPLPPQRDASLPGVLKALHLQQRFADFAVDHQTDDPQALHAAFGAFLAREKPSDLRGPTQPPGVIRSPVVSSSAGEA
jgi:hypothetical protein